MTVPPAGITLLEACTREDAGSCHAISCEFIAIGASGMTVEQMLEWARARYAQPAEPISPERREAFPPPPEDRLAPGQFTSLLVETSFRHSPWLLHPFAVRMAQGKWSKRQIQEWVCQEYQRTLCGIRRHALLAANASEYEVLWGLLARVKTEADSDPVGGTCFALPQLWIKFGIALGLSREEIVGCQPHPLLVLINDASLAEVRFSSVFPVRELVDSVFEPVIYRLWGAALEKSLRLPHDALDYFGALSTDRWGEEIGRSILERWAGSREQQVELWNRYRAEVVNDREWHRLTILQEILDS
ncbi:MAG: hypothetical protein HY647_06545, partial [Acidobacteria bacterium]|nr:hypothetical protein [Acidobacteriota bacterium]